MITVSYPNQKLNEQDELLQFTSSDPDNFYFYWKTNASADDQQGGNWYARAINSMTLTSNKDQLIDIYLVGGGGSGSAASATYYGGGGGGGGNIRVVSNVQIYKGQTLTITIGSGGSASSKTSSAGYNGSMTYFNLQTTQQQTSVISYNAKGGLRGYVCNGGNGGGGGGGGGYSGSTVSKGGNGGAFGVNGTDNYTSRIGGKRYSSNTNLKYPFGQSTFSTTPHGAGGGGGSGYSGSQTSNGKGVRGDASAGNGAFSSTSATSGQANRGGGGGGGQYNKYVGGAGGSGVVWLRNNRG